VWHSHVGAPGAGFDAPLVRLTGSDADEGGVGAVDDTNGEDASAASAGGELREDAAATMGAAEGTVDAAPRSAPARRDDHAKPAPATDASAIGTTRPTTKTREDARLAGMTTPPAPTGAPCGRPLAGTSKHAESAARISSARA
jgi:hypothetical protein